MSALSGFWEDMARDLSGKGQFRLFLQPAMALLLGIRLGIADAKEGRPPFFLRLFHSAVRRRHLLRETLTDAALPLCLALGMDAVFQHLTLGRIRPLGLVLVAVLLVWLPFTLSRALTNRMWHQLPAGRHRAPQR
jgi:hypothetical protein